MWLTNITSGFPFREFILPTVLMKGNAIALANTSLATTPSVLFRLRLPHLTSLHCLAPPARHFLILVVATNSKVLLKLSCVWSRGTIS